MEHGAWSMEHEDALHGSGVHAMVLFIGRNTSLAY